MSFAVNASLLCGQSALLLGWRPDEFWNATPAELGCVLIAMTANTDEPPDGDELKRLMKLFPDASLETENG